MISKDFVIGKLNSVMDDENRQKIEELIKAVNSISNEQWESFVRDNNITESNIDGIIRARVSTDKRENINDFISYGITDDTLHMHIIPEDVSAMLNREGVKQANLKLIDALEHIRGVMREDESIKTVFAVAPILRAKQFQAMFTELGFEVSQTTSEYFLQKFPDAKAVYQASLGREAILSNEWQARTNLVKKSLSDVKRKEDEEITGEGK
ncbi:MAG: hypothetical protein FWC79_02930 [Oscillospiraceae bacterium]|nr:hypothetical protein [Oscillospiraceae bacterium]